MIHDSRYHDCALPLRACVRLRPLSDRNFQREKESHHKRVSWSRSVSLCLLSLSSWAHYTASFRTIKITITNSRFTDGVPVPIHCCQTFVLAGGYTLLLSLSLTSVLLIPHPFPIFVAERRFSTVTLIYAALVYATPLGASLRLRPRR